MNNSTGTKAFVRNGVLPYLMLLIIPSLAITSCGWYHSSRIVSFVLALSSSGAALGFFADFIDLNRTPCSAKGRLVLLGFSFISSIMMMLLGLIYTFPS